RAIRSDGVEQGREIAAHSRQAEVSVGRTSARAVGAEVERDHPEVLREAGPDTAPRRQVEAEPVGEQHDRPPRVAGRPDRELGSVERWDPPEVRGRRWTERLDVARMPTTQERAPEHPRGEGAGHHTCRDCRRPPVHPRYSRGTRAPIRATISYATVAVFAASSHADTSSSS